MSARREVRAAIVELLQAAPGLAGVQVSATPPGENQALRAAVWIERVTSRFEWRGMGGPASYPSNRSETLVVELGADAYESGPRQGDSAAAAIDRVYDLFDAIESAIASDPTLGTGCASALVSYTDDRPLPRDRGWACLGTCRITVSNYPAT